jgi:pectate lyase
VKNLFSIIVIVSISVLLHASINYAQPNFKIIGFATQNGGTTGGQGGKRVTVTSLGQLKSYAKSSGPVIILVKGTISATPGGATVNISSNKSIIGDGNSAFLRGIGLNIKSNNIIIQNIKSTLIGLSSPKKINDGDVLSISGSAKNIWVDHCEFFSEDPNKQKNIDKYDGLIDVKHKTGFITFSWNFFHDHHKCGIVGASDSDLHGDRKITFHHNYYKNVKLRIPMYRGSVGHFFNNYIVGAKDATEIRQGTCVRVEKNYYEALHYSIYTPNDHPGKAERIDNIEVKRANRPYPKNCTANIPYEYASVLTKNTEEVKTIVPQYAGVGKMDQTSISFKQSNPGGWILPAVSSVQLYTIHGKFVGESTDVTGNLKGKGIYIRVERNRLGEIAGKGISVVLKTMARVP